MLCIIPGQILNFMICKKLLDLYFVKKNDSGSWHLCHTKRRGEIPLLFARIWN